MRLLAIDASSGACSVGVAVGDGKLILRSAEVGRAHAERLMPMVAEAMEAAGLRFTDLQRIAVTVGPGSFTGVRIGVAAARSLALATGAEPVGIGTLGVHAAAARALAGAVVVVAAISAGRGEIYAQRFAADGTAETQARLAQPEAFAPLVEAGVVLAGGGADALAAACRAPNQIVHRQTSPDIAALVELGAAAASPDAPPRPLYLRAPDAKPQVDATVRRQ